VIQVKIESDSDDDNEHNIFGGKKDTEVIEAIGKLLLYFRKYGRNSRDNNKKAEQEKINSEKRFASRWIFIGMEVRKKEKRAFQDGLIL
jgi:hypothetical protein